MTFNPIISSWNANGILSKTSEPIHFIHKHNMHIMLINETKVTHTDTLKIKDYIVHRQDRQTHTPYWAAGGVAAIIHSTITHTRVRLQHTSIESLCIKLPDNTHIISAYNKPNNNFTQQEIHSLLNTNGTVLIIGDLNAKHAHRNCNRSNGNGNTLHSYTINHNANIMYPTLTHTYYPENGYTPSTIDILINKNLPYSYH